MNEVGLLFNEIDKFPYPATMKMVKGEIPNRAFFPGGKGTFNNDDNISGKEIMIIGQDFDSEKNHKISIKNGEENIVKNPTWRNLGLILKELNISPNNCFFTNVILGIRKGNKAIGKSPAFKDPVFIKNCQDFFLIQLKIQKPKAIIVLGKFTAQVLAGTADDLKGWSKINSFSILDEQNIQIKKDVIFQNGIKSNLVILTPPSYRQAYVFRRQYDGFEGHSAEIKMIEAIL